MKPNTRYLHSSLRQTSPNDISEKSGVDYVSRTGQRGLLMAVLTLLLTIIVCLVFICGLLLVDSYAAYQRWRLNSGGLSDDLEPVSDRIDVNYTALLAEIASAYPPDIVRATYRRLQLINCRHADRLRVVEPLGAGWTKAVYRAQLDGGTLVALKTVSPDSHDVKRCQAEGNTSHACYLRSVRKFLREVWLMLNFQHPNIVKMIGVCLPGDSARPSHLLSSVVELGEPVDLIRLLQMSWDERLRIFHDLTNLLTFLSQTRLGSMVLDDFRRQQFVLVNGQLKLTDLDDLHANRRPCRHHSQCTVTARLSSDSNTQQRMETRGLCMDGVCERWNERMNLHRNYIQFGSFLLSHGNPAGLAPLIETYRENSLKGRLTLPWLRRITNDLIEIYKRGDHLNRTGQPSTRLTFQTVTNTDASPADSVWCVQRYGCRLTVFDVSEAESVCAADRDCIGFVLSKERSWLNHSIVYLKTKQSRPTSYLGHTLYLKPS